jgi:hypothetical protein
MSISITGRQRDLLYEIAIDRLTGIDDVWDAVEDHRWEDAQRLSEEFGCLLRFLTTDLGWGRGRNEPVELKTPRDALKAAMEVISREAAGGSDEEQNMRLQLAVGGADRQEILAACSEVLAALSA